MKVFIAVTLDKDIKSHLKNMADKLSKHMQSARYTHFSNYHITLVFIGETDISGYKQIIKAVKDTVVGLADFKLKTSGTGSFKKGSKHIIYCEIKKSKNLNDIYLSLLKNLMYCGIDVREGKFTPHITLAREAVPIDENWEVKTDDIEIQVNSVSVMESMRINGKLTYIPRFTAALGDKNNDK